ncbi:MAG: Holliday junction branch migration protein RuvA, partial [Calditrichae bacterium]|nr:Holliday junction branch migration protein RuvA [Calditrichia bacterium]
GQQSEEIELLTHLHVREDGLQLYGFAVEEERDLFRKLINISGIGPRLAMTMLSGLPVEEFKRALASEDVDLLTKVPGVGKKTAQRVILELKEKIDLSGEVVLTELPALTATEREKIEEALRALVTLGYKQYQAKASLEKVIKKHGRELSLEDTIKLALQEM